MEIRAKYSDFVFINESGLEFKDISSEDFRQYNLPNGEYLTIEQPQFLHVSDSGGHRVVDYEGNCYYIKICESWYISWASREGAPHFVK